MNFSVSAEAHKGERTAMIQFNLFNFNVVDLDRSLTFYRDALGL